MEEPESLSRRIENNRRLLALMRERYGIVTDRQKQGGSSKADHKFLQDYFRDSGKLRKQIQSDVERYHKITGKKI